MWIAYRTSPRAWKHRALPDTASAHALAGPERTISSARW